MYVLTGTNEEINFLDIRSFRMVGDRNRGSLAANHGQGEGGNESRNMMLHIMPQLIDINASVFRHFLDSEINTQIPVQASFPLKISKGKIASALHICINV